MASSSYDVAIAAMELQLETARKTSRNYSVEGQSVNSSSEVQDLIKAIADLKALKNKAFPWRISQG